MLRLFYSTTPGSGWNICCCDILTICRLSSYVHHCTYNDTTLVVQKDTAGIQTWTANLILHLQSTEKGNCTFVCVILGESFFINNNIKTLNSTENDVIIKSNSNCAQNGIFTWSAVLDFCYFLMWNGIDEHTWMFPISTTWLLLITHSTLFPAVHKMEFPQGVLVYISLNFSC